MIYLDKTDNEVMMYEKDLIMPDETPEHSCEEPESDDAIAEWMDADDEAMWDLADMACDERMESC